MEELLSFSDNVLPRFFILFAVASAFAFASEVANMLTQLLYFTWFLIFTRLAIWHLPLYSRRWCYSSFLASHLLTSHGLSSTLPTYWSLSHRGIQEHVQGSSRVRWGVCLALGLGSALPNPLRPVVSLWFSCMQALLAAFKATCSRGPVSQL